MARRSLAERTSAVAGARGSFGVPGFVLVTALGAVAAGIWADMLPLAIAGAAAVGWSFRPEHERAYLEGFADGLRFIDEADDGARQPAQPGSDRADLRGLPDGAGEDDRPAVDSPSGLSGGAAAGAGGEGGLRDAFGLARAEPGLARPPLGPDGQPLTAGGPTRSGFPIIPAAEPSGSPISIRADGTSNRRRTRSIRPGQ